MVDKALMSIRLPLLIYVKYMLLVQLEVHFQAIWIRNRKISQLPYALFSKTEQNMSSLILFSKTELAIANSSC